MLRIAGGIILAIFILAIFAAIARPIFKVLAYLLVLYVAIMAAGFLLWGSNGFLRLLSSDGWLWSIDRRSGGHCLDLCHQKCLG
jgi:hypothetical protein